jgi:peptidoglycan hydrolase-like protein with peptidoglycan-binding domain
MTLVYQRPGITIGSGKSNSVADVIALQHDLRALGYLKSGIDGIFGPDTERAIHSLQYDLLNNDGSGKDGRAAVAMTQFNEGPDGKRVTAVTGILDAQLADAIADAREHPGVGTLPDSVDPAGENKKAMNAIAAVTSATAPPPFIVAIVQQESNGQHFHVPLKGDEDTYVTVGFDRNAKDKSGNAIKDQITSRGYGVAQYTLFHHPPSPQEVADLIQDPVRNARMGFDKLREKFDHAVVGTYGAVEREIEHPHVPLRLCRYAPDDDRYFRDCRNCAREVRKVDITRGTSVYEGASMNYQPTQYYPSATYVGVPNRADFLCDWPYAARRYNGGGLNSFHYQTHVLLNLSR